MGLAWAVGSGSPTGTCFLTFSQDHNQTQLPTTPPVAMISRRQASSPPVSHGLPRLNTQPDGSPAMRAMLIPCCDAVLPCLALPCSQHGLPYHRLSHLWRVLSAGLAHL
jgi:hypothetical protein